MGQTPTAFATELKVGAEAPTLGRIVHQASMETMARAKRQAAPETIGRAGWSFADGRGESEAFRFVAQMEVSAHHPVRV